MRDERRESSRQQRLSDSLCLLIAAFCLLFLTGGSVRAQSGDDEGYGKPNSTAAADAAKRLFNRDPLVRQRAAEEMADLAAADWRHLVEGYRLQEKDSRVKLALDWALYRMGKTETLYAVVRALDSSRYAQAQSYLLKLDSPEPLYIFLKGANTKTTIRLLEVFARTGDAKTLERIDSYKTALDPQVARAAQVSAREINARLAQTPSDAPSRPRRVGGGQEEDSP
ncbi:MAG TPA: hypothetical protein VF708_11215 [Pyrinomonadaceae bacterium]